MNYYMNLYMVLMVTVINYYGTLSEVYHYLLIIIMIISVPLLITVILMVHLLLICLLLSLKKTWMETWKPCLALSGGDGGRRQTIADDDGALVDLRCGSGPLVTQLQLGFHP